MDLNTDDIREAQARMERDRTNHDALLAECARLVYPDLDRFQSSAAALNRWDRQDPRVGQAHDPYTAMALADGVSVFESYVMPRGQRWQKLELADDALMRDVETLQWLEAVEVRLFKLRNDPESGFIGAVHDSATSLLALGPQSMWIDDRWDHWGRWAGIAYENEFIGDIWIERDAQGRAMRLHRALLYSGEQAWRKWGPKSCRCVKEAHEKAGNQKMSGQDFRFIHVIVPNRNYDAQRIDAAGKPWRGGYYCTGCDCVFEEGGYHSLPRIVSAFERHTGSEYGRSPTMMVLQLVRMAQEMMMDRAWGAEIGLKPPLLAMDDELDGVMVELRAHGITYGGLDERGDPLIKEFLTRSDGTAAKDLTLELRAIIDRVYYRDLLQLNREYKTHIPAARVEEEKAEKGTLLAPLARQEQEWLSPMTQRELVLMGKAGLLDDMPDKVRKFLAATGTMGIRYDNGLTALQEASKSAAFLALASQVGGLAQFDPSVVEEFKREYPMHKVIPELGRIAGVPASMRSTDEEREAYDAEKAQAAQVKQLLEAAPVLAGAAKDAAMIPAPGAF